MTVDKPLDIVTDWYSRFVSIWKGTDVADVFLDDAGWREHLVFDWDYRCLEGAERIRSYLRDDTVDGQPRMMAAVPNGDSLEVSMGPGNVPHIIAAGSGTSSAPSHRFASKLGLSLPAPALADAPFTTTPEVTAHFRFLAGREGELSCGTVLAIVRLQQVEGAGLWRAKTFFTTWDPHAMSGKLALARPFVVAEASEQERRDWVALCETKPEVVIIGGGHSGLTLAATLTERKIANLVIEAAPSVGWTWAARYPGLHFHGPRWCHSLLNNEFAKGDIEEWVTKETFARKLEEYKDSFGIVVRTNTRLVEGGALWMPDQGSWRLRLEGSKDGHVATMNAAHVAFCVGPLNSLGPRMPDFAQSSAQPFRGPILNTETFAKAMQPQLYGLDDAPLDVKGKRFVVVGHGSSGADIASYLTNNGAKVTVMARGPQLVQSYDFVSMLMGSIYPEGTGRALPDCDVTFRATPYKYMLDLEPKRVEFMDKVVDKDLHDALRAKGVPVWFGESNGGFSAEARKFGGTHLFDPGLKDPVFKGLAYHVVHGNMDYRTGVTVRELRDDYVIASNGDEIEADAVIFSIGYELGGPYVHRFVRHADGSQFADNDQILHSFRADEEGEFTGIFRPIDLKEDGGPNSRLWLASLGLPHSRSYLPLLAMQIQRASLLSAQPVA